MLEQLTVPSTHKYNSGVTWCFTCGKLSHTSCNCRTQKQAGECFNWGSHRQITWICRSQGNAWGGRYTLNRQAPVSNKCLHNWTHTNGYMLSSQISTCSSGRKINKYSTLILLDIGISAHLSATSTFQWNNYNLLASYIVGIQLINADCTSVLPSGNTKQMFV